MVIPTYQREQVLVDTIKCLLRQRVRPAEILIVDQTPRHEASVQENLSSWHQRGEINWIRQQKPSIPIAMNTGLKAATQAIVLFLDDDIRADQDLVAAHLEAYGKYPEASAIVGQVLQPGESSANVNIDCSRSGLCADLNFPFFSNKSDWVSNVMAGNLSVRRDAALKVGGFDENFSGVAYRFETDFARRLIGARGKIRYYPAAAIDHLRLSSGGTRSHGSHLTSASPRHGTGDYYFAFLHGHGMERWSYSLSRFFREVRTRFHLRHPWWIPVKLLGEFRALIAGRALARSKKRKSGKSAMVEINQL